MSDAIIIRNDSDRTAVFSGGAYARREAALDRSAGIATVKDADEQREAVAAQRDLKALLSDCEKGRVACKEPVLEFGRRIDEQAKAFTADPKIEHDRLGALVEEFQTLEKKKAMAREAERNEQLLKVERERQAALAQATSLDHVDAIQTHFDERVAAEAPPVTGPPRVEGQSIRSEWEIVVTDIWALARAHPACVKMEPRLVEIKALLDADMKVPGVAAKKVVKSRVTATRERKALEV